MIVNLPKITEAWTVMDPSYNKEEKDVRRPDTPRALALTIHSPASFVTGSTEFSHLQSSQQSMEN